MREVAEHVAEVKTSHGNLGNHHLEESTEGREDTILALLESETGSGGEVSTLHNTGREEDLRVLRVNYLQAGRALKVGVDYKDALRVLLLGILIEHLAHSLAKLNAVRSCLA